MDATPAQAATPTFIRATEIWVPTRDRMGLELGAGLYGPLAELETVSRETRFAYDEGLPGKAWAAGHPLILKDLQNSYFKRGAAASAVGLTCGVAIPVFAGPFLQAVLVLLSGDDQEHVGAIELWHTPPGAIEMGLVDGYYGMADGFEFSSRHTNFMRGTGLPGLVWDSGMPVIMEDLDRGRRFLRWESAERVGINRGVGIPCGSAADGIWVLTLLSALGTPIARRVECWVPDEAWGGLVFQSGYCEQAADLGQRHGASVLAKGAGTLGRVWRSGVPAIATDLAAEPGPIGSAVDGTGLTTMVALPMITAGELDAVVAWYL